MFSAVSHKKLASAEGYFVEHLAQNDYYAAGEIRPGQWIGVGAEQRLCCRGQALPVRTVLESRTFLLSPPTRSDNCEVKRRRLLPGCNGA